MDDGIMLHKDLVVAVPPERAFALFTRGLASWWIREFTWAGPDALVDIGIEAAVGGLAYEIGPHGFRVDWGRVLVFEPPHRFVMTWQIDPHRAPMPDPAKATEVEVRFEEVPEGTRVTLEHRGFERHGADGPGYRDGLLGGWDALLARYRAAAV
jgi:uncharacterized protein YndB with AHSA1/START domain